MNETSGRLRPAVTDYLEGKTLDHRQVAAIRAYLRQWMDADWRGPMIDVLRTAVEEITTAQDIDRWTERALAEQIDPF